MERYTKPVTLTSQLRLKLSAALKSNFKANDAFRLYLKAPKKQIVSFKDIVNYAKSTRKYVRQQIPLNMHYNKHVKAYWQTNPKGSHQQCVKKWWAYKAQYYLGNHF